MSTPTTTAISYAPPPRWHRRRAFRRILLFLGLAAVVASAYWWAPPAWRHVGVLRLQRRCATFDLPPDRVVYDADPVRAAQLQAADPRYVTLSPYYPAVGSAAPEWDRLYATISPPGKSPSATVFLHERRVRRGAARLVAVDAHFAGGSLALRLTARCVRPGDPMAAPALVSEGSVWAPPYSLPAGPLRLFAGQPDPADPSHFTIAFESNTNRGTLDGWLLDDGVVNLELRQARPNSQPATNP